MRNSGHTPTRFAMVEDLDGKSIPAWLSRRTVVLLHPQRNIDSTRSSTVDDKLKFVLNVSEHGNGMACIRKTLCVMAYHSHFKSHCPSSSNLRTFGSKERLPDLERFQSTSRQPWLELTLRVKRKHAAMVVDVVGRIGN